MASKAWRLLHMAMCSQDRRIISYIMRNCHKTWQGGNSKGNWAIHRSEGGLPPELDSDTLGSCKGGYIRWAKELIRLCPLNDKQYLTRTSLQHSHLLWIFLNLYLLRIVPMNVWWKRWSLIKSNLSQPPREPYHRTTAQPGSASCQVGPIRQHTQGSVGFVNGLQQHWTHTRISESWG
jgi:hypothetical protein